jgi:SAM-dependent methyltransferase
MPKQDTRPKICDYEGSNYRTEFWEGQGRDYEDQAERIALRRLLPPTGKRLLEIGAGFGRLTQEYNGYRQVVLVDYSLSQLQYAQEHLGKSDRFVYVAADVYKLPFRPGIFDAATMIRVLHHMSDVPTVLEQIRRAMVPGGVFILEYANKRNLKAIARYLLKKQSWSPFDLDPVEFIELNFDFHPGYIHKALKTAKFAPQKRLPVSFFRLPSIKNRLPTGLLVKLDSALQRSYFHYTPSIFVKSVAIDEGADNLSSSVLFACPECGAPLSQREDVITCKTENLRWAIRDGIYDFKAPLD